MSQVLIVLPQSSRHIFDSTKRITKAMGYFAFIVLIIIRYIGLLDIETSLISIGTKIMILTLFGGVVYSNINKNILFLFTAIGLYILNNQALYPIQILMFVYLLRNISISHLTKCYFICSIIFFVILLFLLEFNFIHSYEIIYGKIDHMIYNYGFKNTNGIGLYGFFLSVALYILSYRKSPIVTIIIIIILNEWIFRLSGSRTFWFSGLALIVSAIFLLCHGFKTYTKYLIALIPIICTIGSFYLLINASEYEELNMLTSNRIAILAESLDSMNIKAWLIGMSFDEEIAIDCAYVSLALWGGIIWLTLFLIISVYAILIKFDRIKLYIPIIIGILVSGIGESTFSYPSPITIIFWLILFKK